MRIYKRGLSWYLHLKPQGADITIKGEDIDGFLEDMEEAFPGAAQRFLTQLRRVLDRDISREELLAALPPLLLRRIFRNSIFKFRSYYGKRDVIWDERDKFLAIFRAELFLKIKKGRWDGLKKEIIQNATLVIEDCFECR